MDYKKAVNDFIDRQTTTSLRLMLFGPIALVVVIFFLAQIRPVAKSHIEDMLDKAGFEDVVIGDISFYPSSIRATDIKLDKYGFDHIDQLDASLNWPKFLTTGKISQLEIKGMDLIRDSDHFASGGRQLAENLLSLPPYRVALSGVTLDLDTGYGAIRVLVDATAEPSEENHNIRASIKADQYQLGFASNWQGTLNKDGALDLAGEVVDGRLNLGPLRISRFNGWVGTAISKNGYTLQSQLEAGSATFMNVPLQTISMVNDSKNAEDNVIVRSGISGMPDILFTADMRRTDKDQNFTATLKGKNLGGFLDYIDEVTKTDKKISESLLKRRAFELTGTFQPEKRFAGGPMPFGLTLIADGDKILDGNVLFYPDSFNVRGSLESDTKTILALKDYFKIPSDNIVQNFIRLDGDAKKFLGVDEIKSKTQ